MSEIENTYLFNKEVMGIILVPDSGDVTTCHNDFHDRKEDVHDEEPFG